MQQPLPEQDRTSFTGQIVDQLSPSTVAVWDLDYQRRFLAFNVRDLGLQLGELVLCQLSDNEQDIIWLDRASPSSRLQYAERMFNLSDVTPSFSK